MTLFFDHWPPKSDQFVLESVDMCTEFTEIPIRHSSDIAFTTIG